MPKFATVGIFYLKKAPWKAWHSMKTGKPKVIIQEIFQKGNWNIYQLEVKKKKNKANT